MGLSRRQSLAVVSAAGRAPSAHNTQPARFRFPGESQVELWEDTRRRLPVGDPEQRDGRAGLGMAFEGLALALSEHHLGVAEPLLDGDGAPQAGPLRRVAVADLEPRSAPDPLAPWVSRRHTYRGSFVAPDGEAKGSAERRLRRFLEAAPDLVPVMGADELRALGRLHDHCTVGFLAAANYRRELYRWLRFSRRDAGWDRDGLSADCLSISPLEARLARWALRPGVLGALVRLGLARPVVSEASAVDSASAAALVLAAADEDPFHAGRRWYRAWLALAREGFAVCPMSALADAAQGRASLRRRFPVPEDSTILNVVRIGVVPAGPVEEVSGHSRRLPAEELLLAAEDPGAFPSPG